MLVKLALELGFHFFGWYDRIDIQGLGLSACLIAYVVGALFSLVCVLLLSSNSLDYHIKTPIYEGPILILFCFPMLVYAFESIYTPSFLTTILLSARYLPGYDEHKWDLNRW